MVEKAETQIKPNEEREKENEKERTDALESMQEIRSNVQNLKADLKEVMRILKIVAADASITYVREREKKSIQ